MPHIVSGSGGGGGGPITLTGPVTGSGTSTIATTITASAITLAMQANLAVVSLMGNPTGSPAAPSAITLGTGLAFSGATLKNSAPFLADTQINQNNSIAASVTTWEGISAFVSNTAGAETTSYTSKLLNAGAQFISLYQDPTGFLGIGSTTINIYGQPAGSVGITMVGSGSTGAQLEGKIATPSFSGVSMLQLNGYNGSTLTAAILLDNNHSTVDGRIRFFAGNPLSQLLEINSSAVTAAISLTASASFTAMSSSSLEGSIVHTGTTVGFLSATPAVQQTGGVATAGGVYTSTEQNMLQKSYNALRTFGFLS